MTLLCLAIIVGVSGHISMYNNSCLYSSQALTRDGPRNFDCQKFVIDSTDEIWNMNRTEAWVYEKLDKYMDVNWQSITNYGEYLEGMKKLRGLVITTREAFPDLRLHIVDTFCVGNDIDGYKTTMPVIHSGTHLGWHPRFGKATGKR